jgi:hypothetical protein
MSIIYINIDLSYLFYDKDDPRKPERLKWNKSHPLTGLCWPVNFSRLSLQVNAYLLFPCFGILFTDIRQG